MTMQILPDHPLVTLRDLFAAAALTGLCTRYPSSPEDRALLAYKHADAMLREREANNENQD